MSVDKELEELLEKARALPPMTEEQRWEQKISFAFSNLAIDRDISRPEFEANAWKLAWRKSQERILKLRKALEECSNYQGKVALQALVEDSESMK